MAQSSEFARALFESKEWRGCYVCLNIDEAHAMTEWGHKTFRPEDSSVSSLRSRLKAGIPVCAASATPPSSVLLDVKAKLGLPTNTVHVAVSNAKPNVALSVRTMKHTEDTFTDIASVIPHGCMSASNIPITLIYVESCQEAEDIKDVLREQC